MSALFISDLHLSPDRPGLTRLVTDFLLNQPPPESLYILGDIFNTWLGDDLVLGDVRQSLNLAREFKESNPSLDLGPHLRGDNGV